MGLGAVVSFFVIVFALVGCGSKEQESSIAKPESKFGKAQALIAVYCANCHDGVKQKAFDTEARWLESKAKARIENGSMPPNKPLEPQVKTSFLETF